MKPNRGSCCLRKDLISGSALFVGEQRNDGEFRDLTFKNYQHIVNYLSVKPPIHAIDPAVWALRARKIKGVRVHCRQDQELQFTPVACPLDHPIFNFDEYSEPHCQFSIFDRLGLPLISREGFPDWRLEYADDGARCILPSVASVYKCLSPSIDIPQNALELDTYTRKQIDITFVRADGKDLTTVHMRALWGFIEHEIIPANNTRRGLVPSTLGPRGHIVDAATKANFERYFQRSFSEDPLLSPYNVV